VGDRESEHVEAQKCRRHNKREERSVVSSTDAVVKPDAMMIFILDTVVALTTVTASWRPVYLTRLTVL
jgi:hypothetical protein